MKEELFQSLEFIGYQNVLLHESEILLCLKKYEDGDYFILIYEDRGNDGATPVILGETIQRIQNSITNRGKLLSVIITKDMNKFRYFLEEEIAVWFVDSIQRRRIVFDNQPAEYRGAESAIDRVLEEGYVCRETLVKKGNYDRIKQSFQANVCTIMLVSMNVLIFLFLHFVMRSKEEVVINQYGLSWFAVTQNREYIRIITHMFLHGGIEHLLNNMIVLGYVGSILESVMNRMSFLVVYFGSGIIAAIVSMGYNKTQNDLVISVGASGAIFGLVGAMAYIVIINRGRLKEITARQIVIFVILSLYGGFTASNVDNAAHIGGFIAGVLLASAIYRRSDRRESINED